MKGNPMPNRDWLCESLEEDYDAIVARQQPAEHLQALQDAQDKGATIEETMSNVHDDGRLDPSYNAPRVRAACTVWRVGNVFST
jgi:hypothetical protein